LIQGLVMFGNLIGRNRYFEADGATHHFNLYTVLVGLTSKGRKGTSWAQCGRLFSSIDELWFKDHIQSGLSSGEGLPWAVRDPIPKTEPVREGKRVIGYQEILADPGVSDKRLTVFEAEFASILKVMGREGSTLSAQIRQAWDSGNLRILNKNSPVKSTGAHISIVGHITKDELLRYLDSTEAANGFANRFLWVCVKRSKCLPDGGELHRVDFASVLKALSRAANCSSTEGQMKRDSKAREIWHAVYPTLSEGQPGLFAAITSRSEAQVMRLACLYALLDCADEIRAEHLQAALALWSYCEESARYIFGDSVGDPIADTILKALKANLEGLTRTQISSLFGRHRTKEQIDQALFTWKQRGNIDRKSVQTEGRNLEVWFAVPHAAN